MDGHHEGEGMDAGEPTEVIGLPPEEPPAPPPAGPAGSSGGRRGLLLAALAALIVLIGAVVVLAGDDGDDDGDAALATDTEAVSSTSSSSSSTSSSTSSSSSSSTTVTTLRPTTTAPSGSGGGRPGPGEEPPERRCVDAGGGPATPVLEGWESRWQTKPQPNDPVTLRFCIDDVTVRHGDKVTATLVASDPDAVIVRDNCGYGIDWLGDRLSLCRDALIPVDSPRPTPPEQPGHIELTFSHVYERGGIYTVEASVWSAEWNGVPSPYSSYASATIDVTVFGDIPISP